MGASAPTGITSTRAETAGADRIAMRSVSVPPFQSSVFVVGLPASAPAPVSGCSGLRQIGHTSPVAPSGASNVS